MVGNDIIDIFETKRISSSTVGWKRPGFVEKIFSSEEQMMISNSQDPFSTVWRLWSMKESAYKVYIQSGGERFYNPAKLECSVESLNLGSVSYDGLILKTNTVKNSDYIFSTAFSSTFDIDSKVVELPNVEAAQQSAFIRQQLLSEFSKVNSIKYSDLSIQKSQAGVPLIHFKNKPLHISISITHDGKYGAYSILKY